MKNIDDMTTKEIEKYLEDRKKVKPIASLENVAQLIRDTYTLTPKEEVKAYLGYCLDWTPYEKPLWMRELVEGMPCLWRQNEDHIWDIGIYSKRNEGLYEQIPFNESKLGKVTE